VSSPPRTRQSQRLPRHRWALAVLALALFGTAGAADAGERGTRGRVQQPTSTRRPLTGKRPGDWRRALAPSLAPTLGRQPADTAEIQRARSHAARGLAKDDLHQYFTTNPTKVRAVLSRLDLSRHIVIELGVGTGIITREVLRRDPIGVIGYEIEPELVTIEDERLAMVAGDFTRSDLRVLGRLRGGDHPLAVIANPPYKELPFIKREIIDKHDIKDVLLMIPARRLKDFPAREGYRVVAELSREDFSPPAAIEAPRHLLIARGFLAAKSSPRRPTTTPMTHSTLARPTGDTLRR
jgi:hypothetical protein